MGAAAGVWAYGFHPASVPVPNLPTGMNSDTHTHTVHHSETPDWHKQLL